MKNVLIVEDDQTSNLLYETCLKKYFNVFSVFDTKDIYNIIEINKIDLVLLDLRILPDNGFIVAEKIKKDYPNIKIIAQTAQIKFFSNNNTLSNFDLYLEKPIPMDTLLKSVKILLK